MIYIISAPDEFENFCTNKKITSKNGLFKMNKLEINSNYAET